jgi:hypothetical protein
MEENYEFNVEIKSWKADEHYRSMHFEFNEWQMGKMIQLIETFLQNAANKGELKVIVERKPRKKNEEEE